MVLWAHGTIGDVSDSDSIRSPASVDTKRPSSKNISATPPTFQEGQSVSRSGVDSPVTDAQSVTADESPAPDFAIDDPSQFQTSKDHKRKLQASIERFNWKPSKGLDYLAQHGLVDVEDPKAVGKFLFSVEGLDKRVLGDYLGEGYVLCHPNAVTFLAVINSILTPCTRSSIR